MMAICLLVSMEGARPDRFVGTEYFQGRVGEIPYRFFSATAAQQGAER
jgi:hypothetical protein